MSEKQIIPEGLTKTGWKKVDELLARANKEQIRTIITRCIDKLPDDKITLNMEIKSNVGEK